MGYIPIKITDKHSVNLDEKNILEYSFQYGECVDTNFLREEICRDYNLKNRDDDINNWIDKNYPSQQSLDQKMNGRFYEELHLGEVIAARWKDK